MTTLEQEIHDKLNSVKSTLGQGPRLINEIPQVEAHGLKHGLTGKFTYLNAEELADYARTAAAFYKDSGPRGMREIQILQCIIDAGWRLGRIPQIAEAQHHSYLTFHTRTLNAQHPGADPQSLAPYAENNAFHYAADDLGKLARYQTTLTRTYIALNKEFDRMRHFGWDHDHVGKFNLQECKPYQHYIELLALAERLIEARRELRLKSKVVEPIESAGSEPNPASQNRLEIINPLTKIARKTFETAADWGLLTGLERTVFTERAA
jgi:hypothetical protein